MEWYNSEGSREPLLIDCDSSPTTVFLRRNVQKVTKKMDDMDMEYEAWVYEECKISHDAYQQIMSDAQQKARSDIDFIAMVTEVDLDE